jgi:hypothetical protein
VSNRWRVPLPAEAEPPYRVFINGVRQEQGRDYELRGRELLFDKPLAKEGRLGFWRWTSMFIGLVGTYRKNDSVDVHYTEAGEHKVAVYLDIIPPDGRREP